MKIRLVLRREIWSKDLEYFLTTTIYFHYQAYEIVYTLVGHIHHLSHHQNYPKLDEILLQVLHWGLLLHQEDGLVHGFQYLPCKGQGLQGVVSSHAIAPICKPECKERYRRSMSDYRQKFSCIFFRVCLIGTNAENGRLDRFRIRV